jgi:enoyl-CoA hydratase/carnithine racemase
MNRPAVLNAQDWELVHDFHYALDLLDREAVRPAAVIVSGAGRAFSSGIDLKALAAGELGIDWFRSFDEAMRRLETLPMLTVARMHSYALGGGLMVGLACDFRVAASDTHIGFPAVKEALVPGMATYRLPRFVGLGRAKRLVLTGELLDAESALQMGLIDWVVPAADLEAITLDIVHSAIRNSATARCAARELLMGSFELDFEAAMARYLVCQQQCLASDEHAQAMAAYHDSSTKTQP